MADKIVLIDGHSILNRAFYGVPILTNGTGLPTNAVYGFLNILFKILDEEKAQYLAVAFDLHAPTFRHKMFAAYKGTRHEMPQELRDQVPVIKRMLKAMGVPLMMLEGYEADDLLGTVSLSMENKGLDVCIVSGDRDLLQLASETTMIRIPKTKKGGTEVEDYLEKDVEEHYCVTPSELIDVKALMGDASDNIPGIPGVGEKTAARIIAQYHTIEEAYAHISELKPPKAQKSLQENWDDAVMSKALATIDRHAPFELDLASARLSDGGNNLYTPQAMSICKELELRTLITRFSQHIDAGKDNTSDEIFTLYLREADADLASPGQMPGEKVLVETGDDSLHNFISRARNAGSLGLQILEAGGRLIGAGVALKDETAFICRITKSELSELSGGGGRLNLIDAKEQLSFLDDGSGFDRTMQGRFFDAAIGAYLLNPLSGDYPYDVLSKLYAGRMTDSGLELLGKKTVGEIAAMAYLDPFYFPEGSKKSRDASGPSDQIQALERLARYACLQARTALDSRDMILKKLEEEVMRKLFDEVEMPLVFVLYHMQREGVAVRGQELKEYGKKLNGRIGQLEKLIYEQAGKEFNINSPRQMGQVLFEDLGLPFAKKTKTGYSTSADVLDKLSEDFPIVSDILEYRQLTKLKSTYADGLAAFIAQDGRIHGKFNQTVTATGRISSADPNLQNIPVRTPLGRELRKVFVPKDGCVFVDADYSQIELRILAHVSGDQNLIDAYNSAEDIHAITASQVFHVPLEDVTPQLRRNAKAVNFGIVYGISSFGLSQGLSITRKEAQQYIEQYFRTYPGIKGYLDECVNSAKSLGYSVTLFGRRRPVPELRESNFMRRSFGERVAMNAPIQGTAADIIKIAMIGTDRRLREEGLKSRLVLQIHDELLVETDAGEVSRVREILRSEMEGAAALRVRLEIDMHDGANWFEAH